MIASWMLYCGVVSALLGLAALSLEHALRRRGLPLRWVWVVAIGGSLALSAAPWFRSSAASPAAPYGIDGGAFTAAADPLPDAGATAATASAAAPTRARDGGVLPEATIASLRLVDRYFLPGWALASAAALLLLVGSHGRLRQRRRRWRAEVVDEVPVLVSKEMGPAVVGFIHTKIVVPEWVLGLAPERRRLVLAHETEHLRAGDPALLLAAFILLAAMPWNAPLWWLVRRLRHAVELDCDARVLHGTRDAAAYGELLIDVGEQAAIRRLGVAAFAESSSLLADRIRNLTAPRPRAWRVLAASCVSAAALLLAVGCDAPTPAVLDPQAVGGEAGAPVREARERADTSEAEAGAEAGGILQPGPEFEGEIEVAAAGGSGPGGTPEPRIATGAVAGSGAEHEVELITRSQPNIPNLRELIRQLHPDVYRDGLPRDRALWIAIDLGGRIRESWVGPNLYMRFDDARPRSWLALPEGSPEERRAKEEHRRAVQQELSAHVPGMRARARYAAYSFRPVPITLHLFTEAPGTPAWGGRDTLATDVVIRTSLPISGERLSLPAVEYVSWRGERWSSAAPARIIEIARLERVGETFGRPIFAEAGLADPDVIYRLEREPSVFVPFRRER